MANSTETIIASELPRASRGVDWSTRTLDISMVAGWTFLLVLTARVLLDL